MAEVVVFRLAAPLAAFGDVAVGERRGTASRPSHSAIAGLVASAFGLPRGEPGHEAIAEGFHLAVRIDVPGTPLADFHTAQAPPQRRGRRYATRALELRDKDELGTIISRRDYLADVAFTVVLWPTSAPSHAPQAIAKALNRPVFAPFAGRRSCPLGEPVDARVVGAETVTEALAAYDAETAPRRAMLDAGRRPRAGAGMIAADAALADRLGPACTVRRRETRRDRLASRARWQFALREELVAYPSTEGA